MTQTALIRPAWTPATIALMVLGFIVFWPLGLAMLAYIVWGDRLPEFKSKMNRAGDDIASSFGRSRGCGSGMNPRTGNVAFDDWRAAELKRIEEERRKLDEMREEFDAYLRELRRAKDQQEFDSFMAARKTKADTPDADTGPVADQSDDEPTGNNGTVPGIKPSGAY